MIFYVKFYNSVLFYTEAKHFCSASLSLRIHTHHKNNSLLRNDREKMQSHLPHASIQNLNA